MPRAEKSRARLVSAYRPSQLKGRPARKDATSNLPNPFAGFTFGANSNSSASAGNEASVDAPPKTPGLFSAFPFHREDADKGDKDKPTPNPFTTSPKFHNRLFGEPALPQLQKQQPHPASTSEVFGEPFLFKTPFEDKLGPFSPSPTPLVGRADQPLSTPTGFFNFNDFARRDTLFGSLKSLDTGTSANSNKSASNECLRKPLSNNANANTNTHSNTNLHSKSNTNLHSKSNSNTNTSTNSKANDNSNENTNRKRTRTFSPANSIMDIDAKPNDPILKPAPSTPSKRPRAWSNAEYEQLYDWVIQNGTAKGKIGDAIPGRSRDSVWCAWVSFLCG